MLQCLDKGGFHATVPRFTEARQRYLGLVRVLGDRTKTVEDIKPDIRRLVDFFKPMLWSL